MYTDTEIKMINLSIYSGLLLILLLKSIEGWKEPAPAQGLTRLALNPNETRLTVNYPLFASGRVGIFTG